MSEKESLKKNIADYIEIDDQIKELNDSLKQLRNQKKDKEADIISFMEHSGIDQINVGDGKIKMCKTKKMEPLNKDTIYKKLISEMSEEKAHDLTNKILSDRVLCENSKISRV